MKSEITEQEAKKIIRERVEGRKEYREGWQSFKKRFKENHKLRNGLLLVILGAIIVLSMGAIFIFSNNDAETYHNLISPDNHKIAVNYGDVLYDGVKLKYVDPPKFWDAFRGTNSIPPCIIFIGVITIVVGMRKLTTIPYPPVETALSHWRETGELPPPKPEKKK